jgi:hypothetical protein
MAYTFTDELIGLQPINVTDTVQRHPEGMLTHAVDPTLGGGEFLYLKGVVNTVAGSVVTYNQISHATTLSPAGAVSGILGAPAAVAMSANVANQWGWYQVTGVAVVAKDGSAPAAGAPVYFAAAAGQVTATPAAGRELNGAGFAASALAGATTVQVTISRPFVQGAIT